MKFVDYLSEEHRKKLEKMRKKKKDKLSKKDILELMGVYRDTYRRKKGGALRSNRK
jgi:RNA polymerase-interacting CarD/CdnL/TRCF family regulator